MEQVAPSPRIRAGLTTRAEGIRISSSVPLTVRAGSRWVATQDVLIEKEVGAVGESRVYTVQVVSFLSESHARDYLSDLSEETGYGGRVQREQGTGRFAVRVGSWATADGARASVEGLSRMGHDGARVVAEPRKIPRPRGLVLHRLGAKPLRTSELSLRVLPSAPGAWIEVDGRPYRGFIEISVNPANLLTVVNLLNIEDYLKGVVPAELSPAIFPELEAIKAQAVAARTYAIRHRGQYAAEGFDICTTADCQVYRGVGVEQRMGNEAVLGTASQILTYGGEPIDALYTSTCGGRTEDVENVFDEAQPYLVSRPCFLERSPIRIESKAPFGVSWEAAAAVVLGIGEIDELTEESLRQPVSASDVSRWAEQAVARLGQHPCPAGVDAIEAVTAARFAQFMARVTCWEGRLPFLLSDTDTARLVSANEAGGLTGRERRALAYWVERQWLLPPADGLSPLRPLSRLEVLESLYRLVESRGEAPLDEAVVDGIDGDWLVLSTEGTETKLQLAPRRFLYRRVGDSTYYSPTLSLLPGDRILSHRGGNGIDLLILLTHRSSFDRSSRFHRWAARKSQEELTRTVNRREPVGQVLELRPRKYGKSGRVVELEIVGAKRTVVARGLAIRRMLGLRENLFYIDRQLGADKSLSAWVFTGGGWGHGVGLCQIGAYGMAAAGYDYLEILRHYYPGTEVKKIEMLDQGGK